MNDLRFYARREAMFGPDISLYCHVRYADGQRPAVPDRPVQFRVIDKGEEGTLHPPLLTLTPEAAQRLVDELWVCGIRPSEGSGSAGSLAATERHLADMRAIVANSLGVEMPKK
jgi:hypothetical protein